MVSDMNDNGVTHLARASASLLAVEVVQDALREEYRKPVAQHDTRRIAGWHQAINYGLKAAEVHSHLAIAEELTHLRASLVGRARPDGALA